VQKNEKGCVLRHFVLVTLLPTGHSRVMKKFSSRSQSKTSWPPPLYKNHVLLPVDQLTTCVTKQL